MVPRFGEFCFCSCLPHLLGLALSVALMQPGGYLLTMPWSYCPTFQDGETEQSVSCFNK